MNAFLAALLLSAGYNTALVSVGAALLGASAAIVGTYVLLRKRSLVSDAISHATLPGLVLAFMAAAWLTGEGRSTVGLMVRCGGERGAGPHRGRVDDPADAPYRRMRRSGPFCPCSSGSASC